MSYEPEHLARTDVATKGRGDTPYAYLGKAPIQALGAQPGDTLVVDEQDDGSITIQIDDEGRE